MYGFFYTCFFIIFVGLIVVNFILFDILIKLEYERFNSEWVKDGKPRGMFNVPPGSIFWNGNVVRNRLLRRWIFYKPDWIERDEKAEKVYKYFRLTGIILFLTGLLIVIGLVFIFFMQP